MRRGELESLGDAYRALGLPQLRTGVHPIFPRPGGESTRAGKTGGGESTSTCRNLTGRRKTNKNRARFFAALRLTNGGEAQRPASAGNDLIARLSICSGDFMSPALSCFHARMAT